MSGGKRKVSFNCKDRKTGKVGEKCFEAKEKQKSSKGGSKKKTSNTSEPRQDPRNPEFPADKKMSNYTNTGTKTE